VRFRTLDDLLQIHRVGDLGAIDLCEVSGDLPVHQPGADSDSTISSAPLRRRWRFLAICGSKDSLSASVDFGQRQQWCAVVPQAEEVSVQGEDVVFDREGLSLGAETGGGDEDGHVRSEMHLGAQQITYFATGDRPVGCVPLALDHHGPAVGQLTEHVGSVVPGPAHSAHLRAAVTAA